MDTVNVKINGRDYTVSKNATVLEACREASINIPTLCFMKDINAIGACRLCLVEIKGARSFAAACVQPVSDGMEIMTNTPAIQKARKAAWLKVSAAALNAEGAPEAGNDAE